MTDTTVFQNPFAPHASAEVDTRSEAEKAAAAEAEQAVANAKQAAEAQAAKDKAAADIAAAKAKAAHIVSIVGGKPKGGIGNSVGDDGVPIPRDGVLTIALITTISPWPTHHPGTDINCVARLPDKSEVGDLIEVYCVPGLNGSSAFIHPPKKESIGVLPVSTGDNVGTGVAVSPQSGRLFRKISAANWQVLGA